MEHPTSKSRTPSRCREWERNRRNKFNEAINRLGAMMKEVHRNSSGPTKDMDTVQLPKVEIVEKAILYLRNLLQETTQLKADIMALQIKIESFSKQALEKKDASTQVFIGMNKKKNGKYVKVLMLRKSKQKALKEKSIVSPITTVITTAKDGVVNTPLKNIVPKILPTLLPKSQIADKKGPEGTIVVLPAPSYILPQRPLLFPTAHPAFVLLDPNMQTLNKPTFPIVNRNNGDITKTTMVNILPISAYSAPISVSKVKKNNGKSKLKSNAEKKTTKIIRKKVVVTKENTNDETKVADDINKVSEAKETERDIENSKTNPAVNQSTERIVSTTNNVLPAKEVSSADPSTLKEPNNEIPKANQDKKSKTNLEKTEIKLKTNISKEVETVKLSQMEESPLKNSMFETEMKQDKKKSEKLTLEKHALGKHKENKTQQSMLHDSLCENVVDGGNARLELAEEFLAASPTAAFLMSFPLVSGNRADSPAEEQSNTPIDNSNKITDQKRNEVTQETITQTHFEKPTQQIIKLKPPDKLNVPTSISHNQNKLDSQKYNINTVVSKHIVTTCSDITVTTTTSENPFLSLPSLLPTSCALNDSTFSLDFDCHLNKSMASQPTSYPSTSNIFYKSDSFSSVKNTIYSTSNISSGHEFNSFGLYPCAMEKYSKNKSDYSNVEDNLMKIGTSRLTYDIDLGWSHKGFDFVNCSTAPNTFSKDNILTTVASGPYSTSYNPFNPDFHIPLMTNSAKKDNPIKSTNTFPEVVTSLYSQPPNPWSEDVPFYTNTNVSKSFPIKHNFLNSEPTNTKPNISKQYETKPNHDICVENVIKPVSHNVGHLASEKYTKKSQSKMHINWMTSETRPMQPNCIPIPTPADVKETLKPSYSTVSSRQYTKKQDHSDGNYFPISMSNYPSQPVPEDLQTWPASRPAGTTEISIEPPPINLPTLVGDLALGPHDKKKSIEAANRASHPDIQNCSNFFSVTQLMNRSTDNLMPSRYHAPNIEPTKSLPPKHSSIDHRKTRIRPENQLPQPCYGFGDSKNANYEMMSQYPQPQSRLKINKSDKSSKSNKNSYSAESLIRGGGTFSQKLPESNTAKFLMQPNQKYNDFNAPQDSSVAQVSHFPAILDYSENNYAGQQFSGTTLYNSTTNTISNSFYSNFMPPSGNLMTGNYTGAPFAGEYTDYNHTECNYTNYKYDELKMRGNPPVFQQDKVPTNYKSGRRETIVKHKLECSKKESSKKYPNKRAKVNAEVEEWSDAHMLWPNKAPARKHSNLVMDETPFPNYVSNQVQQCQPEFFNSHLMPSSVQTVGPNVDRSSTTFPATSRANFNLSSIFPEITMKVQ